MNTLVTILYIIASTIMWLCILLFLLKAIWNLFVPYAMIREALYHPEDKHGWSMFILFDVAFLIGAVLASIARTNGSNLSPLAMLLVGVAVIVFCYVHLASVLLIAGWKYGLFVKPDEKKTSSENQDDTLQSHSQGDI